MLAHDYLSQDLIGNFRRNVTVGFISLGVRCNPAADIGIGAAKRTFGLKLQAERTKHYLTSNQ